MIYPIGRNIHAMAPYKEAKDPSTQQPKQIVEGHTHTSGLDLVQTQTIAQQKHKESPHKDQQQEDKQNITGKQKMKKWSQAPLYGINNLMTNNPPTTVPMTSLNQTITMKFIASLVQH